MDIDGFKDKGPGAKSHDIEIKEYYAGKIENDHQKHPK